MRNERRIFEINGAPEPPQKLSEAKLWGWVWVDIRCRDCRGFEERNFDRFPNEMVHMPLARAARGITCAKCHSADVSLSLGCWRTGSSPSATLWPLAFDGERTISSTCESAAIRGAWQTKDCG